MVSKFTSQPKNKEIVSKINDVIDVIPTNLATVATSGSYNDLSNKPTIPTVNNATLTIQKNGTTVKTFTANASSNVTCNITVPTNTNELTNGAGFISGITSSMVTTALGYTPYNSTNPSGYISSIPSSYLQNTATGTGALTINGTASAGSYAVNIGSETASTANYGTAIGYKSKATASSSTAIGRVATAGGSYSIAIGYGATISSTGGKSIQLGYGTNSTASSLSVGFQDVGNYQLLDGTTGLIPDERISTNIQRTLVSGTSIKTINNQSLLGSGNISISGGGTVDQTFDGTSTNAQSGVSILGLLELMYPVGAIFIGTTSTCPMAQLFGTWSLVAADRVLQGSSSNHAANSNISAGLPNITGTISGTTNQMKGSTDPSASDALSITKGSVSSSGYQSASGNSISKISFSAKNSNSIYGSSSTVQPPAYVVNVWRRTA